MKKTHSNIQKSLLTAWTLFIASISTLTAIEVVIRQGADIPELGIVNYDGTQDNTLLSGANAFRNYGGSNSLFLGRTTASSNPAEAKQILQFDLSALDGLVESIDSVTLTMRLVAQVTLPSTDVEFSLHQIQDANAGWVEGTGNAVTANSGESSWNYLAHSSTAWAGSAGLSTPGTDYLATPIDGTRVMSSSTVAGTIFSWTLPVSLVESWIEGTNAGLILSVTDYEGLESDDYFRFGSSEHGTAAYRPTLTINYTPIPEPGAAALFLVVIAAVLLRRKFLPKAS